MRTISSTLHPAQAIGFVALTVGSALFALTGSTVQAAAPQTTTVLLPEGIHVDRPRGVTTAQQFFDDLALQKVAADVAAYSATMSGTVPVLDDLIAHLEPLYDHVWDATAATVKYQDVIVDGVVVQKICYLEHKVFVKNDGEENPAVVTYYSTTLL